MRAWARMFSHIWRYSTVFCAQMLVNASLLQSAPSWRWLTTVICAQTFRQDDPCPQKISAVLYARPQGRFEKTVLYNVTWKNTHRQKLLPRPGGSVLDFCPVSQCTFPFLRRNISVGITTHPHFFFFGGVGGGDTKSLAHCPEYIMWYN